MCPKGLKCATMELAILYAIFTFAEASEAESNQNKSNQIKGY